jgi:hypothetical protein
MLASTVFEAVLLLKRTQSQHKISSWGLGSWDPAVKEHTMAYDKQITKGFCNDV